MHHHSHTHHDHHHGELPQKVLRNSFFLIAGFMFVEAVAGKITGSLALLSDAGHMLSDAAALFLAWQAQRFAVRKSDTRRSFGYRRLEVLAAAVNGLTLVVLGAWICVEALLRLRTPVAVMSGGMLIVAVLGLLVNIAAAWMMMRHSDNLNVQSALWHVMGDLLGSVAAIAAAVVMLWFNWWWADAVAGALVAVLIMVGGIRVLRESGHILLEGAPKGLPEKIHTALCALPEVAAVHDVHVWSLTANAHNVSAHLVVDEALPLSSLQALYAAAEAALQPLDVVHCTFQVETHEHPHGEGCTMDLCGEAV